MQPSGPNVAAGIEEAPNVEQPTDPAESSSCEAANQVFRLLRNRANIGLILVLFVECAFGVWVNRNDQLDVLLWIIVGTVLIFNTARRLPAVESDTRWWVWIVCTMSTVRFLAFESTGETQTAYWMLVFANLLADTSLIALGRSFSIMPARRTIRRGWMYRIVRHPAYATYIIIDAVYVSQLPTFRNLAVTTIGVALFVWRASLEERILRNDPVYRDYAQQTRWRFLPFVY